MPGEGAEWRLIGAPRYPSFQNKTNQVCVTIFIGCQFPKRGKKKQDKYNLGLHHPLPHLAPGAHGLRRIPVGSFFQGCGVGVEAGVGVDRSRSFCRESESELESVKFRRFRLRPGVAGYQPLKDNDFGRTTMHRPFSIKNKTKRRAVGWRLS